MLAASSVNAQVVVAFALGIIATTLGQWLAHKLTTSRERRSDLMATLDKTIASVVAGEHAVQQFIANVGTGKPQPIVQASADAVSAVQIEMRAAMTSLAVRLGTSDDVVEAFREAEAHFVAAFQATGPALVNQEQGPGAVAEALAEVAAFGEACERAFAYAHAAYAV